MSKPNPNDQIECAQKTFDFYRSVVGESSRLGDVLCDLMHLCKSTGGDFEEELNYAKRHLQAEDDDDLPVIPLKRDDYGFENVPEFPPDKDFDEL